MDIIRCDDQHCNVWNDFVDGSSTASVYHRYEWRSINEQSFGHKSAYLAAREQGQVVGVFPLVQVKSRLFGNIACSMPFVNYGGPCGDNEAIEQALLDDARAIVDEWGADYLEIRGRRALPGLPTSLHKVSMTLQLDPDPEALFARFTSSQRQDIRKGYKQGMSARVGGRELIPDFYAVLSESWRDMGTPIYSFRYLRRVAGAFKGRIRVTVVYAGDVPAAAAFDLLGRDTIEGLWLGSRAKFRRQLAGYVLYWELVKHGCERGFRRYHLGRSTVQSGGEAFKKKWNAVATQLYWHYVLRTRTEIPQLNVDNPKYQLAIKAWQKLPVPLTQMVGPFISRSIP